MGKRWQIDQALKAQWQCAEDILFATARTQEFLQAAGWAKPQIDKELNSAEGAGAGYQALEKRTRVLRALEDVRLRAFVRAPEAWVLLRLSAMLAPTAHLRACWESLTPENQRVARWACAVRELRVPDEWPDMRLMLAHLQAGRVILAQRRAKRVEVTVVGNV